MRKIQRVLDQKARTMTDNRKFARAMPNVAFDHAGGREKSAGDCTVFPI